MFTTDEIQLMKMKCPSELEKFLNKLSIRIPDSNDKDDFSFYGELDDDITEKMCRLMKSDTVVQGYTKLLDSGNVSYAYSETDNELLNKIVRNKDTITHGINNRGGRSKIVSGNKERVEITSYTVSGTEKFDSRNFIYDLEDKKRRYLDNPSRASSSDWFERLKSFIPKSTMPPAAQHLINFLEAVFNDVKTSKKENLDIAKKIVEECIKKVRSTGNLFELVKPETVVEEKNLPDYIRSKAEGIPVGSSKTICITIEKTVESREKKIAEAPSESGFTDSEIEKIFDVLEQANKIVRSI